MDPRLDDQPGPAFWIGSLRATRTRRLDDVEAASLSDRLAGELRDVRRAHIATRSIALLVALGVATYFGVHPGDTGFWGGLFASLGALILVLGPTGAVLEVVFGATAGRIAFPAAAIVALVGWSLKEAGDREPGPWGLLWVICFAVVLVMGGCAMLLLRLLSRPRRLASLRAALVDVAGGEVQVFDQADAASDGRPVAGMLEILPLSKLAYRIGDQVSPELREAPVVVVGRPSPGTEPGIRRLSGSELAELATARPRLRRAGVTEVLFATWGAAIVFRAIERWVSRSLDLRLSSVGWACAGALGILVALARVRRLRAIARDLQEGVVARSVAMGPEGAFPVETLPISKQPWAINDVPAPWRGAPPVTPSVRRGWPGRPAGG